LGKILIMGSFYSTCSVTGMTLSHQSVVRLLIVPSALSFEDWRNDQSPIRYDSRNILKGKGLIVSNNGAQAVFSPFGFPIRGKYYDYGQIDEIQRDKNVKILEEYFGLSIEQIFDAASDDRWYKYGIERPKECLAEIATLEEYVDNDDEIILTRKKALEDLKKKYHYDIYESPKTWRLAEEDPKHIDTLLRLTYTDIHAEIYDFLVEKQSKLKEWWCKEMEEEITEYLRDADFLKEEELNAHTEIEKTLVKLHGYNKRSFIPDLCKDNFLNIFKIGSEWEKEYRELYNFLLALGSLNKILLPSNYGSQEDNFSLLMALNRKANSLMREDKKEI
jgi:hypothetical protein